MPTTCLFLFKDKPKFVLSEVSFRLNSNWTIYGMEYFCFKYLEKQTLVRAFLINKYRRERREKKHTHTFGQLIVHSSFDENKYKYFNNNKRHLRLCLGKLVHIVLVKFNKQYG